MKKTEKTEKTEKTIKVNFNNTYIGTLGLYYKGKTYELTDELYKLFKNDCEEIK
jgi:hypothetical protein